MNNAVKFLLGFKRELNKEFTETHLTGNLLRTTEYWFDDRNCTIRIPAREYDMLLYLNKGIFKYKDNNRSYALKLNEEGSTIYQRGKKKNYIKRRLHLGNHKGYVDKCIDKGVKEIKGEIIYDN